MKTTTPEQDAWIAGLTAPTSYTPPPSATTTTAPSTAPTRYRIGPPCPTCGNTLHGENT